ncbi:hypothetical protein [Actinacidiphila acididurans]|uniref:Uncharacterized protein n=1 Tax=Actinacidiphila acididurans TaxID=2784346 RepID=A0ABS2U3P4_9ACTN|nr:hypothetical protein [Actinacidiphila acididurans]MBM9509806.1 hypothetical protein [Actinacidiphila acididurans]
MLPTPVEDHADPSPGPAASAVSPLPAPRQGAAPAQAAASAAAAADEPKGCLYALSQPPLMLFLCVIGGLIGAGAAWDLLFL